MQDWYSHGSVKPAALQLPIMSHPQPCAAPTFHHSSVTTATAQ
jgi:hypothetical protein